MCLTVGDLKRKELSPQGWVTHYELSVIIEGKGRRYMKSFLLLVEPHCLAKSNPSGTIIVTTINVYTEVSGVKNKNWKMG